jgi:hypothetical protein
MNTPLFPNADKVGEYIESEPDPVVRSLMRLVYGQFLLEDSKPEGAVDMMYCFKLLQAAFRRKDALANALEGKYGDPNEELEWE